MRPHLLSLFVVLVVVASLFVNDTTAQVDPNANAVTKQIYSYFKNSAKWIVGQELGNAMTMPSGYTNLVEKLHTQTGKYVGLIGLDYAWTWEGIDINAMHAPAVTHWNKGGLLQANFAPPNPWTGKEASDRTGVNLNDLLTPGNAAYTAWYKQLDLIASFLADLQTKGISILWRPLHEMNGDWNWWGQQDATLYKRVWIAMFNYYTNTKKLHNLIWVYAPNAKSATAPPLSTWYPGAAYVDILGQDVYDPQLNGFYYDELLTLANGKPIALCEVGPNPTTWPGGYDWNILLNLLKTKYPKITYFMAWSDWKDGYVSIISNNNAYALMNDPAITTVDKINYKTPQPTNANVYLDALSSSWTAGAWSQSLFTLTDTYAPSSTYNIKAVVNGKGGVSFRRSSPLLSSNYASLSFLFISYGEPVMLWLLDDQYHAGGGVIVNNYIPSGTANNAWAQITIPLSDLGVSGIPKIGGFELMHDADGTSAVIFLDTIVFKAKTSALTPAQSGSIEAEEELDDGKDETEGIQQQQQTTEDHEGGLSGAAITGIVMGSVIGTVALLLVVAVVAVVLFLKRRITPAAPEAYHRMVDENL